MPPRPPLANTAKVEVKWNTPTGRQATNIFYLLASSLLTDEADLNGLATAVWTVMNTTASSIAKLMSSSYLISEVTVADNTGATENVGANIANIFGTNGGAAFPPSVAIGVSWSIAARYRGGHPRWYIPGVTETMLATAGGSLISGTFQTSMETAASNLLTGLNGMTYGTQTYQAGTISYRTGNAPRPTPLFRAFTGSAVHPRVDSQRRRLGKEITP